MLANYFHALSSLRALIINLASIFPIVKNQIFVVYILIAGQRL